MNTRLRTIVGALAVAVAIGGARASAQSDRWQLRIAGLSTSSTELFGGDPRAGLGVGLEYRLSPWVGLEIGGLATEAQRGSLATESSFRMTSVLARLDLHFTPTSRVDFYGGPVGGYVRIGEVTTHTIVDWPLGRETRETRASGDDKLAWGLALGLDVPIGGRGSFLTFGATYLELPLEVSGEGANDHGERVGDFDPLIAHVGYGVRF